MVQQHDENASPQAALTLFYCYARKDKALRDEIDVHLASLHRSGLVTSWHDAMIVPGMDWEHEIDTQLDAASIILLLVSPDFLHSDYCYGREMQRAIDRHNRGESHVIPILLRPVDWENTPLSTLQMLPTDATPVTQWINRDAAFADIARNIRRVVNAIIAPKRLREKDEERPLLTFEEQFASTFGETTVKSHLLATSIKQSGITEVVIMNPAKDIIFKNMAQCQNRLLILDSWMWDNVDGLEDIFRQLAFRKVSIRILLLDPDSVFAQQRSRDLRFDENHVPNCIRNNVKSFIRFRKKFRMNKLEIRYYTALPSLTLYIYDNQSFVGFYLHNSTSLTGPQLQVLIKNEKQEATLLGGYIEEEFATIWERAKPILELKSPSL